MSCKGSCQQGRLPCIEGCEEGGDIAVILVVVAAIALPFALVMLAAVLGWVL